MKRLTVISLLDFQRALSLKKSDGPGVTIMAEEGGFCSLSVLTITRGLSTVGKPATSIKVPMKFADYDEARFQKKLPRGSAGGSSSGRIAQHRADAVLRQHRRLR